jgi:hypothetical protein
MERWLFIEREPRKKIEDLAYKLREEFGNLWDFSRENNPESMARQPLPSYSLEQCFMAKEKMKYTKLVIGQEFFGKPQIRLAFSQGEIWADFFVDLSLKNYRETNRIFKEIFGVNIRDYKNH